MIKTNEVRLIDANALLDNLPKDTELLRYQVVGTIRDMPTITLNDMREDIYLDAVAHGLWEDYTGTMNCVNLIRDEVRELDSAAMECGYDVYCNDARFSDELANVIIMCLSVAGKLGIDIDDAVKRKMEINKGRPWKHGKEEKQC